MTDYNLDILFITETWLSPLDSPLIATLNSPPYQFIHNPRDSPHPGGGTGILYKSTLTLSNISHHSFLHSEALSCAISSPFSRTFNISLFYRPPSPSINLFLDEFRLFLHSISPTTIIQGDFNIPNPPMTLSLNKLLHSFNLTQHITSPTHVHGNTLDLIISPKSSNIITDHSIGPPFSDHFLILLILNHPKPTRPITTRITRQLHNIPISTFIADLSSNPITTSLELHNSLATILDKHAPLLTITSITRPDSSWFTKSLLKQKRILRTAENLYLKHPSPTSLASYNALKNTYRKAITTAKASHISLKFAKISNDSKSTHILSSQLLGRTLKAPLPICLPEQLPLLFKNTFND